MNTVWIIVAVVVAIVVVVGVVLVARSSQRKRRVADAERIREEARAETVKVERREALAEETAAKAKAAQAEAEVKAAEAARLQDRAATHKTQAASAREGLDEQFEHADRLDPHSVESDDDVTDEAPRESSAHPNGVDPTLATEQRPAARRSDT